jgi:hypothetical protein
MSYGAFNMSLSPQKELPPIGLDPVTSPPSEYAGPWAEIMREQQETQFANQEGFSANPEQQATPEQPVGFNPMLMNLFLRAHGNEKMSKAFAQLLVADVATKQVIANPTYYSPAAAYIEATIQRQASEAAMSFDSEYDDNVLTLTSSRKRKKKSDNDKRTPFAA